MRIGLSRIFSGLILPFATAIAMSSGASAQVDDGPIGQRSDALVNGAPVAEGFRESHGLVTLSSGCSGSLLKNNWVLTAAHCIDNPDPSAPGAFLTMAPASLTVTADWGSRQMIQAVRIVSYRPLDVAIVEVGGAFLNADRTDGFNQSLCCGDPYPEWDLMPIELLGRGINRFATGAGVSASPSQQDGLYRYGNAQMTRFEPQLYWYSGSESGRVAGGDSGGPSFVKSRTGRLIVGVHAMCRMGCVEGQICGRWPGPGAPPPGYSPWRWVAETSECADAPVQPVAAQIREIIAASASKPPVQSEAEKGGFGKGKPDPAKDEFIYTLGRDGRLMRHVLHNAPGAGPEVQSHPNQLPYQWANPSQDDTGGFSWNYKTLVSAGTGVYGVRANGDLDWYRPGESGSWSKGPVKVGSGWADFVHVFGGGDNVIYAVNNAGDLLWYRHLGAETGEPRWQGPILLATGWTGLSKVFSAGDGVIFGIFPDGSLFRWKHLGFKTGTKEFEPGANGNTYTEVGSGWADFPLVFAGHENVLYAVNRAGEVFWYQLGYQGFGDSKFSSKRAAAFSWQGPVKIKEGWQDVTTAFVKFPATGAVGGIR